MGWWWFFCDFDLKMMAYDLKALVVAEVNQHQYNHSEKENTISKEANIQSY